MPAPILLPGDTLRAYYVRNARRYLACARRWFRSSPTRPSDVSTASLYLGKAARCRRLAAASPR